MGDEIRSVARAGLAPFVEEVPEGPDWDELVSAPIRPERRSAPGWLIGVAAALVVFGLVGIGLLFQPADLIPPVDSPVTTVPFDDVVPPFDADVVAPQAERWWDLVIGGDNEGALEASHPDAQFDIPGLIDFIGRGAAIDVDVFSAAFSNETQPELCFVVTGRVDPQSGSMVYRVSDGEWLLWEVRPNVERCADEDVEPSVDVTSFDVIQPVPITVLASDSNGIVNSAIDFVDGTIATSAASEQMSGHSSAIVDGESLIYSWTHDGSIYENGTLVLEAAEPAFSMRVLPLPVRDGVWVVYTGGPNAVADLYNLSDGERVRRATVEDNAFPVGVWETGLVFNTERHVDSGDGLTVEPGSQRVVTMNSVGEVRLVTEGTAIAVGEDVAAVVDCPTGWTEDGNCWINSATGRTGLFLADLTTGDRVEVVKPSRGDWMEVGGPIIPSDAMPFDTVSPDGNRLLVRLGQDLDVNGVPATSQLVMVDLVSGGTTILVEYGRETPVATWSRDGNWVVTFDNVEEDRIDVTVIEVANPVNTFTYEDLIPDGQWPMAPG